MINDLNVPALVIALLGVLFFIFIDTKATNKVFWKLLEFVYAVIYAVAMWAVL